MQSDFKIQNAVIEQLSWNPLFNLNEVNVAVKNGVVKLSGKVDMLAQKLFAERVVKRVGDVRAIDDEIEIKVLA